MNPLWGSWLGIKLRKLILQRKHKHSLVFTSKIKSTNVQIKTSVSQLFLYAWQNLNVFSDTKFCVHLSTTYLWRSGSWTIAQNRFIFYLLATFCCYGSDFSFIFHFTQIWAKKGPFSVKIHIKLSDRLIWRLQLWAKSRNPFTPSSAATQGGSFFFSIISFNLWLEDFSLIKMFSGFTSFWLWWINVKIAK